MTENPDPIPVTDAPSPGTARRVLDAYTGEHGVYGVVLVTALIALGEDHDTDLDVLLFVVGTVFVFWLAHVYAGVVSQSGTADGAARPLRSRIRHAARHTGGLLLAVVPPTLILWAGVFGLLDESVAYIASMLCGVVVLGVIGFLNATRNKRPWWVRIGASVTTAMLGVLVILLDIAVH